MPEVRRQIMVVEDDVSIGQSVRDALDLSGYQAALYQSGAAASRAFDTVVPDLVLLDAGLPDVDGFTLCRRFRAKSPKVPIVMVTARDTEIDIVLGLDAGANDYVTKPFSLVVLLARVRAHLRDTAGAEFDEAMTLGSLRIDPVEHLAWVDGQQVDIRPREFQLLVYLVRNVGKVVTRERLLADIWDTHWESASKTVDMHILALRRKVGAAVDITTVRGVGYRMVAP